MPGCLKLFMPMLVPMLMFTLFCGITSGQTLNDFDKPFVFTYGAFDKSKVSDGVAHLLGDNGRSGAGHAAEINLAEFGDKTPVLHIKLGPTNKAQQIRLVLDDAKKNKRLFVYDLAGANDSTFTAIYPQHGLPLSPKTLGEPDQGFDPGAITANHLQGDWTDAKVDLFIDRIVAQTIPDELKAQQQAHLKQLQEKAQRDRQKAEREQQRKTDMLAGKVTRPTDGPRVLRAAPVAEDVLGLYIEEMQWTPAKQVPYVPQPGDEVRQDKAKYLALQDGKPAWVGKRVLWRKAEGSDRATQIGTLVDRDRFIAMPARTFGTRIDPLTLMEPTAYRIHSTDDSNYATALHPNAVYRKSVPNNAANMGPKVHHSIYLKLPHPLKSGATYRVELTGLNTVEDHALYQHIPRKVRTESLHVSHVGFRPGDPFKRGVLSLWMGSGGAAAFQARSFEILDATSGATVFTGSVQLALAQADVENLSGPVNRTGTNVYHLDFHAFAQPGQYVLHLPGVGVSYPFRIADDVWAGALTNSMHGLLVHRSGLALEPSVTNYQRPRPMHPADGLVVYQTDVTIHEGESAAIRASLQRLLGESLDDSHLKRLPFAWGGYMDAGDWDRRSQHLHTSLLLMEAFEAGRDRLAELKFPLPIEEANNAVPDFLDEVRWNVEFYIRLQREDGGVRGGIESTEHPREGEGSWQESLLVGAFDVDPVTTYRLSAAAARLARLIKPYDSKLADQYRAASIKAWQWAKAQGESSIASIETRNPAAAAKARRDLPAEQALAAAELYRLTSEAYFHEAFREVSALSRDGSPAEQMPATFAYASLPADMADASLHRKARDAIIAAAEASLKFQSGNALGIAMRANLPLMGWVGYYTTPETSIGPVLTRAFVLTGEVKYLRGAIAAAQYTLGANPLNITMTTGLGHDFPRAPLHVDSRNAGLPVPAGITLYGIANPASAPGWVKQWIIGSHLQPAVEHWPAAEFYMDVGNWPEMNEYTVHQSIGPVAYYWAFLHGTAR